jgi:hypothetical protein
LRAARPIRRLTSPWPDRIYAYRAITAEIEALGPLIAVDLSGFGRIP